MPLAELAPLSSTEAKAPPAGQDEISKTSEKFVSKLTFSHNENAYDLCCGNFPNVRPYNSKHGRRKCCGDTGQFQKKLDFNKQKIEKI